ncbi:MAG: bifunctional hydroxymethylpyrimidine kinase/phosphomethylpyrimidine kinase [Myxococcales bacterium]|nr:bifunctional hydroxymethylpyrimidine kinase/phosphomethylpyrimidine kinase [Myxococcales bacterium]
MTPTALTIAGSDPSGGAGLQADLKTFHQHSVYGMAVVSLLTVQSTRGVTRVDPVSAELLAQQLDHLLADLTPGAAKTGALGNAALVEVVAARAKVFSFPLVVDPVMISKHGHPLIDASAVTAVKERLLPVSFLLTPNTQEAAALTGRTVETLAQSKDAAKALAQLGARHVLVKGGHLDGAPIDVLLTEGTLHELHAERIDTKHTHGTGCTYSAAIVARLSLGAPLLTAVTEAKAWLTRAIATAPGIGSGVGPVNHFAPLR